MTAKLSTGPQITLLVFMLITFVLGVIMTMQYTKMTATNTPNYYRVLVFSSMVIFAMFTAMFSLSMEPPKNLNMNLSAIIMIAGFSFLVGLTISVALRHFTLLAPTYNNSKIVSQQSTVNGKKKAAMFNIWSMFFILLIVDVLMGVMVIYTTIDKSQNKEYTLNLEQLMMIITMTTFTGFALPILSIHWIVGSRFNKLSWVIILAAIVGPVIALILGPPVKEGFFFEVSPHRAACLKRQVSRDHFGDPRSCGCCGKGTVGGIPPNYAEWLNVDPDTGSLWHRPDGQRIVEVESDTFSNAQEAVCTSCGPPAYITYL